MAKVAVMGYGVVGSGVVEVLNMNKDSILNKVSDEIEVKYILDIREFKDDPFGHLVVNDFNTILNDDEVTVVAETMGGLNPAYDFTKKLLKKGKSVVTSNKELVATKGTELLQIAKDNNVNYLFEASVGGGIPIIRPLNQCLAANTISSVKGILNGTTNYILTKMFKEGADFKLALANAQKLGYAEKDPTADVEGYDACRKIAILASLAFGKEIDYNNIKTIGISDITAYDVKYAEKADSVIKLIGSCYFKDNKVYASVEPSILSKSNPLSGIEDVFNGILVKGNAIGDCMFYGKGAGKMPTASAVVADIIDSVMNTGIERNPYWEKTDENFVAPYSDIIAPFMIRIKGKLQDYKEILEEKFDSFNVIDTVLSEEFAIITPDVKEEEIEKLGEEIPVVKKIRILR